MDRGSVYRRCGCRDKATGRLLGARCPGLRSREHGSWYFTPTCRRRRESGTGRGAAGSTQDAASAALEALASPAAGPEPGLSTGDVQAMFTAVIRNEGALGRPVSAATLHRIHATLRAALNGAARAVRAQRGRAGTADQRQPGQVPEAAEGPPAVRGGVD